MKLRQPYRNALKKYKTNEILNLYRDKKLDLNEHEWKHLHRKIDKEHLIVHGIELTAIISSILCLIIIFLIAKNMKPTYQEKIVRCNNEKHHVCNDDEIEEMFMYGDNNR